jgi:hypothetical protein
VFRSIPPLSPFLRHLLHQLSDVPGEAPLKQEEVGELLRRQDALDVFDVPRSLIPIDCSLR